MFKEQKETKQETRWKQEVYIKRKGKHTAKGRVRKETSQKNRFQTKTSMVRRSGRVGCGRASKIAAANSLESWNDSTIT